MADCFLDAMQRRFACKGFEAKKIDEEKFDTILEYARLSPSSFGMEPWRFLVVTKQEHKEHLRPLCWNQKQITSCSHLVIIKANTKVVQDEEYIVAMFARRGLNKERTSAYIKRYKEFLQQQDISCWTKKQCYIAAANMMTGAAHLGIDSCPIEGFEKEKVEKYLELEGEEVALLIAFGYCVTKPPTKQRLPLKQIVEYL